MRTILIIFALTVVVYARPEPPSGYQYQAPSSRYGAPSASGPGASGFSGNGGGASASASASASAGYPGRSSDTSSQGIVVNKHVYVHVAPPDTEDRHQPKARVHVPPPQKHYKIIFIKAPTPPTPTVPDIPPIQQDEEKTLVYVLVKKPEDQPEIQIPTAAPTEPSKPEVYFIRYKTQKDESGHGGAGVGAGPSQDFSQIDASLDDTVEVGAARQAGGPPQGGSGFSGAPQGGASQSGASASAQSFSSGGASSRSSSGPSSQYGAPSASGPY